jgi:hypothetical protein
MASKTPPVPPKVPPRLTPKVTVVKESGGGKKK